MIKAGINRIRAAALTSAAALLMGVGLGAGLGGCVVEEKHKSNLPEKQPEWVRPARLLVAMQLPEDTDANGYMDTVPMIVYLFDDRYPLAISSAGTFSFKLKTTAGHEIGVWTIDAKQAAASVRKMKPGPGYQFRLDVRQFGPDKRDSGTVDLTAEFKPEVGNPVTGSATAFRLGRAGV